MAEIDVQTRYRAMKKPAYVGEIRMKSWRTVEIYAPPGLGDRELGPDETERRRIMEYWQRQTAVYGYEWEGPVVQISRDDLPGAIVTSSVKVTRILPGPRGDMGHA